MPRSARTPSAANDGGLDRNPAPVVASRASATPAQRTWLRRGLNQPGGKLPLFDREGRQINPRIVRACLKHGWAEPWFSNPLKPDWLVCKLTETGRDIAD
jgi:hypothetical protein